jgi:hypothetical protein
MDDIDEKQLGQQLYDAGRCIFFPKSGCLREYNVNKNTNRHLRVDHQSADENKYKLWMELATEKDGKQVLV